MSTNFNLSSSSSLCNSLLSSSDAKDGGLPLVLGINITIAAVIFSIFVLMHCCFKDFIMAAVKQKKRWPPLLSGSVQGDEDGAEESITHRRRRGSSFDTGKDYCESIIKFLTMSEHGVRMRSGPDASLYLTMELYLLAILCVYSFFSITFILPINYLSGDLQINLPFARTTVSNISAQSPALWSHVIFSLLYVIIAGIFMLHYSVRLGKTQEQESSHTVMINGVPKFVHVEDLMQHFEEAMPGTQVVDIRFAYDIRGLYKKWKEYKDISNRLQIAEAYDSERNEQLKVHTTQCICVQDEPVDAKEYYTTKLDQLRVVIAMERSNALANKLTLAFVTFSKKVAAKMLVDMYKPCKHKPESSLTDSINSKKWSLSLAPYSLDLLWENLACNPIIWWIRWCLINIILIIFLIFFTTPPVLFNSGVELWLILQKKAGKLNITNNLPHNITYAVPGFIQSYFSSFLLWLLGFLMLFFVIRSVYLEYYWSKSQREHATMRKAYILQVLQIIILPSLGLTSLSALGALVVHNGEQGFHKQLSCVFLPNNGAFFVSYIIIATFVSSPLELLRLPQLLEYIYRRCKAKTHIEKQKIYKKILRYDFTLGVQYAYNLLIFTLTTAFSLTTPLIVPFGTLFFVIKYLVDKYNLLYGYQPTHISGRQYLHKTALKYVMVGTVHLQLVTLFYAIVREGKVQPRAVVMMIMISVTGIILFGLLFLGWFSYLLPRMRIKMGREYSIFGYGNDDDDQVVEPGEYIAAVLLETADGIPTNTSSLSSVANNVEQGYESFGRTIAGGKPKSGPAGRSDDAMKKPLVEEEDEETSMIENSIVDEQA